MESGLTIFRQDYTCPALLEEVRFSTDTGLSPAKADLSRSFSFFTHNIGLIRVRSPLLTE